MAEWLSVCLIGFAVTSIVVVIIYAIFSSGHQNSTEVKKRMIDTIFGVIYWMSAAFIMAIWFSLVIDRAIHGRWLWAKKKASSFVKEESK